MLNVYVSPSDLFLFPHLSLPAKHQLQRQCQLQQSPVLQFPFPALIITTDATPNHWAFIFRLLDFLYPVVEPGWVLYARFICVTKKMQTVALMLYRMAFFIRQGGSLTFDKNTAKACLCNQGGKTSFFFPH